MAQAAREAGAERLIGLYRPTTKNGVVADLYDRFGFTFDREQEDEARWVLDLAAAKLKPPFIRRTEKGEVLDLAVAR
jgi:predicted enzyme involved in methoxymalonyl-ACP biosynthesis